MPSYIPLWFMRLDPVFTLQIELAGGTQLVSSYIPLWFMRLDPVFTLQIELVGGTQLVSLFYIHVCI
jgi:hypothetical protein